MRITIVGSGTAVPMPGHSPASVGLRYGTEVVVLDLGPGALARMSRLGLAAGSIRVVCLSHHHADHVLDLLTLLQFNRHTPGWRRSQELILIGGIGTERFVQGLLESFPDLRPVDYSLSILEGRTGAFSVGEWEFSMAPTGHTPEAIAFRVSRNGKDVVYTGDAIDVGAIAGLAQRADVLIAECSFPRTWETSTHFTVEEAAMAAAQADVARLILTHRYPAAIRSDVARHASETFKGEIFAAFDGLQLAI